MVDIVKYFYKVWNGWGYLDYIICNLYGKKRVL